MNQYDLPRTHSVILWEPTWIFRSKQKAGAIKKVTNILSLYYTKYLYRWEHQIRFWLLRWKPE